MNGQDCKRFVARKLVDASGVHGATFVDLTGEYPVIEPFSRETAATVYISDPIILLVLQPEGREATLERFRSDLSASIAPQLAGASTPSADILPVTLRGKLPGIQ